MKILLDPGHGGNDPGAVNAEGIEEEDIALDVALKAKAFLEDEGVTVLMTRDADTYISPADRLKLIKKIKPDCFVSIHCNASDNKEAHGIETIYRDDNDYPLAAAVHCEMIACTSMTDRKIKTDGETPHKRLAVLGDYQTPACLAEIGFITGPDYAKLDEDTDRQIIAEAIGEGIICWWSNKGK